MNSNKKVLDVKNLQVSFGKKKSIINNKRNLINIIRGVDIKLYEGQIVGIVGESGSGKSVTTKTFLNANYGSKTTIDKVKILDYEFESYKEIDWKKIRGGEVAYVPQNPMTSMSPSRKIGKHIIDVLDQHKKELKTKKEKLKYASEILSQFNFSMGNLEKIYNLYPHELSGGMKQRIIIGMAIMSGAKIIIADEPTTALDVTVQSSVLSLLKDINKKYKVSIIFISHNIAVVSKLCSYIYVMYAGKVVEKAPTKELFVNPKHPYTWALFTSIPEGKNNTDQKLPTIPGTPPDMSNMPIGDPFASRNIYAREIDFKKEPPLFEVNGTKHMAATWMLHPDFPKISIPKDVQSVLNNLRKAFK